MASTPRRPRARRNCGCTATRPNRAPFHEGQRLTFTDPMTGQRHSVTFQRMRSDGRAEVSAPWGTAHRPLNELRPVITSYEVESLVDRPNGHARRGGGGPGARPRAPKGWRRVRG